jgi:hypothetical protein
MISKVEPYSVWKEAYEDEKFIPETQKNRMKRRSIIFIILTAVFLGGSIKGLEKNTQYIDDCSGGE